jgi:hypothetical protein
MKELEVRPILANSPQAKGRVERANGTLQDRLVKEMRLAKFSSIEQANAWLDQSRFFQKLSQQFGVKPADAADGHRPVVIDLSCVLCVKERRSVAGQLSAVAGPDAATERRPRRSEAGGWNCGSNWTGRC